MRAFARTARPRLARRLAVVAVTLAAVASLGATPMWFRVLGITEPIDPATSQPYSILPDVPLILSGPGGTYTALIVDPTVIGDTDLVVRVARGVANANANENANNGGNGSGPLGAGDPSLSKNKAPLVVAEPLASGVPFQVSVLGWVSEFFESSGAALGRDLEGMPVVISAFPDLDDDGYVGVTRLDGDPNDDFLEQAELMPVATALAIAGRGDRTGLARLSQAKSALYVAAGGPEESPLRVIIGAAAFIGPFDPGLVGGNVPRGPAVFTALPFLPDHDPTSMFGGGEGPAGPDVLIGVEPEPAFVPNPVDPRYGEAFTVPTDGSVFSVDGGDVLSGAFVRVGAIAEPDLASLDFEEVRPLRPGLDDAGERRIFEVPFQLFMDDDGVATTREIRIVPMDTLGNVTDIDAATNVTLTTDGALRIVSPDTDGDVTTETVVVESARGVAVVLDDSGGVLDDFDLASLIIDDGVFTHRLPVIFPDPDVDDSGLVDDFDVTLVENADKERLGDPGYDPRLDQDGSGRIRSADARIVRDALGQTIPGP